MQGMTEKKIPSAWWLYAAAAAFLGLCALLPVYRLWALIVALIGAAVVGLVVRKLVKPRVVLVYNRRKRTGRDARTSAGKCAGTARTVGKNC